MDEQEWLTCTDPQSLLQYLHDKVSERKQRLLSCACCRKIWGSLTDERSRKAVEVAERFVDKAATVEEFHAAFTEARAALLFTVDSFVASSYAPKAAYRAVAANPWPSAAVDAARLEVAAQARDAAGNDAYAAWAAANPTDADAAVDIPYEVTAAGRNAWYAADAAERAPQANLVREIFGNPFRPAPVEPRWRTPTVLSLAQAAYQERVAVDPARPGWLTLDPARLLVLADALEEAGCADSEILRHLRGPGPHVRGCWCVDWVLVKS